VPELTGLIWRSMDARQEPGRASDYENKSLILKDLLRVGGEGGIRTHVPGYSDHPISPASADAHQVVLMAGATRAIADAIRHPGVFRAPTQPGTRLRERAP
jgi:hypothetical protein